MSTYMSNFGTLPSTPDTHFEPKISRIACFCMSSVMAYFLLDIGDVFRDHRA